MLKRIRSSNKPILLASGASDMGDVMRAMDILTHSEQPVCLMQCNTNYTASNENNKFLNLNVLKLYKKIFKDTVILGLSDHTFGHNSVLGAVAMGARVIEKHFTTDKKSKLNTNNLESLKIISNEENKLIVSYEKSKVSIDTIISILKEQNIKIFDISTDDGDLEDVFLRLTKN